jgi:DNA-binding NarL/FixJ family response regulator
VIATRPSESRAASSRATTTDTVVLVVDDDPQIRTLLRNALGDQPGVRVVTAADGEEGLLRAWELRPALIFADLLMPGMDGATFCRLLRAHPATVDSRVIGFSAADPYSDRARALRAHCVAWVSKPFAIGDLLDAMRRWRPGAGQSDHDQPPPTPRVEWGPLTRREREVAGLVARGLTNRAIAQALVLEEGTVANHIRRILLRLGFHSRTQLAVWVSGDPLRRAEAGLA